MTTNHTTEPDKLVERLREVAALKYQYHTLHAPIVMNAAADELTRLRAEIAELRAEREAMAKQEPVSRDVLIGAVIYHNPPLFASPVPIPEGYALVPKEPTDAMLRSMTDGFIAVNGDNRKEFENGYRAMLAAAPKP